MPGSRLLAGSEEFQVQRGKSQQGRRHADPSPAHFLRHRPTLSDVAIPGSRLSLFDLCSVRIGSRGWRSRALRRAGNLLGFR
jgi:hypothetical protein